jgi:uncharacterized protein (TIGR03000 family)
MWRIKCCLSVLFALGWAATLTPPARAQVRTPDPHTALIRIRVPAGAEISFDNSRTRQRGSDRTFVTPALDADQRYTYEIRAHWDWDDQRIERTHRVTFRPGDRIDIDFVNAPPPGAGAAAAVPVTPTEALPGTSSEENPLIPPGLTGVRTAPVLPRFERPPLFPPGQGQQRIPSSAEDPAQRLFPPTQTQQASPPPF